MAFTTLESNINRHSWAAVAMVVFVGVAYADSGSKSRQNATRDIVFSAYDDSRASVPGRPSVSEKTVHIGMPGAGAWRLLRDNRTGGVRRLRGGKTEPLATDPQRACEIFLDATKHLFGIRSVERELTCVRTRRSPAGMHVWFEQRCDAWPVYLCQISLHLDAANAVYAVTSSFLPRATAPLSPVIDAATAVRTATEYVGAAGSVTNGPQVALCVYPMPPHSRPAWNVCFFSRRPKGMWLCMVDAETGLMLECRNLARFVDGTGDVFDPNPVVALCNPALQDDNDADSAVPAAAYSTVTLKGLDGSGFLRGEYAEMRGAHSLAREPAPFVYDYTRSDDRFEEVTAYYHIDRAQRYIQSLGFTGLLDYPLHVYVNSERDAGTGEAIPWREDSSNYVPPLLGVERLEFGDGGDGGVDHAEDATVILHEYGHAIQENQVPLFGTSSQGDAIGEGFSDYFAASMFADDHVGCEHRLCVGSWKNAPCLRPVNGNKIFPQDVINQHHSDGEIWSGALWAVRDALGGTVTDTLVIQSHYYLNADAAFADASAAILLADAVLYDGIHQNTIRAVLSARGLLQDVVDDYLENNDRCVAPKFVGSGAYPGLKMLDDDYYYVALSAGDQANVAIDFVDANGDIDLELLDNLCGDILSFSRTVNNREQVSFANTGTELKTYSIRVYSFDGKPTAYGMTISGTSDIPPDIVDSTPADGGIVLSQSETFVVTFSEQVTGFDLSDITLDGTAAATAVVSGLQSIQETTSWQFVVSGLVDGTLTIRLGTDAGDIVDTGGLSLVPTTMTVAVTTRSDEPALFFEPFSQVALNRIKFETLLLDPFFPNLSLDRSSWSITSGAAISDLGTGEPSAPIAVLLFGRPEGGDTLESTILDLSDIGNATVTYHYQQSGELFVAPFVGDDLVLEYRNRNGDWVEVGRKLGSAPAHVTFQASVVTLPTDAMHPFFQFRFRNIGAGTVFGEPGDHWFVDDIQVTAAALDPTVVSIHAVDSRTIDVVFSERVGTGATVPANYTLSGAGAGTLTSVPDTVVEQSPGVYRLVWNAGEMRQGQAITIATANIFDLAGNAMGSPRTVTAPQGGMGVPPVITALDPLDGEQVTTDIDAIVVSFSEPVFGVDASDLQVVSSVSGIEVGQPVEESPLRWRFPITGVSEGVVTFAIGNAGTITDAAGNPLAETPKYLNLLVTERDVLFHDFFVQSTFDSAQWPLIESAAIDSDGLDEPTPPFAARFDGHPGGGDILTSRVIDASAFTNVALSYHFQRGGNAEAPDTDDDLIIEYFSGNSSWIPLSRQFGSGPRMSVFERAVAALPAAAHHAALQIRFRSIGLQSSDHFDTWFVDSIILQPSAPEVAVSSSRSVVGEASGLPLTIMVTLGAATTHDLMVRYAVRGSLDINADFHEPLGDIVIAAGTQSATVALTPVNDGRVEGTENLVFTVLPAFDANVYSVDLLNEETELFVEDDDVTEISIVAVAASVPEDTTGTVGFALSASPVPDADVEVNYSVAGTVSDADFSEAFRSGRLLYPAHETMSQLDVAPLPDGLIEGVELLEVQLNPAQNSAPYVLGAANTARLNVIDGDHAGLRFFRMQSEVFEGAGTHGVWIELHGAVAVRLAHSVSIDVEDRGTGDAVTPDDFTFQTQTVTFEAGTVTGSLRRVDLEIHADAKVDMARSIVLGMNTASFVDGSGGQVALRSPTVHRIDLRDFAIELAPGWNLFSVPFAVGRSFESLFNVPYPITIWTRSSMVPDAPQQTVDPASEPTAVRGYWVYVRNPLCIVLPFPIGVDLPEPAANTGRWLLTGAGRNMQLPYDATVDGTIWSWDHGRFHALGRFGDAMTIGRGYLLRRVAPAAGQGQ